MAVALEPEWDEPASLCDICLSYCARNLNVLATYDEEAKAYSLFPELTLPSHIGERLMALRVECGYKLDDAFMHLFRDPLQSRIRKLSTRNTDITGAAIKWMLKHRLMELDISECLNVAPLTVADISEHSESLVALCLGGNAPVLLEEDDSMQNLHCPKLKALSMKDLGSVKTVFHILEPLQRLTYLDLSYCDISLHHLHCLDNMQQLTTLKLHNIYLRDLGEAFDKIQKLTQLRFLDLSHGYDNIVLYDDTEKHLSSLLHHLPHLTALDLSGTNLAGFQKPEEVSHRLHKQARTMNDGRKCSIPGLEGRMFDFLGLYDCAYDACFRDSIPAKQVTGTANCDQVLLAVQTYCDHVDLLIKALNEFFNLVRSESLLPTKHKLALQLLLNAMRRNPLERLVQISASASLFYVVKSSVKTKLNAKSRREIIRVLLTAMDNYSIDSTMLRNGCLTLCQFQIPQDVMFMYEKLVCLLLDLVVPEKHEEFVQRIGIHLLNCLCCQVEGHEKQLVGDLGAIKSMLALIKYKLDHSQCDEILETAWSTMWNVTDETPVNCERFLSGGGMMLFLNCLEKWQTSDELIRNMMGLMGNLAEVKYLRPHLMSASFVKVFSDLLESTSDGIEVSYNACGVLAHMTFDGASAWNVENPSRAEVLSRMEKAMDRWNINADRNINYRSFEPIIRLLVVFDTPQAQHWAVWALCNLTNVYPKKYCSLVRKEQGLHHLYQILRDPRPYRKIKELAKRVIDQVEAFKEEDPPTAPTPVPEAGDN